MNQADIDNAADLLVAARNNPTLENAFDPSTMSAAPGDYDDVYQIQHAVASRVGKVGGWKAGADAADAKPVMAPIFASEIITSPATVDHDRYRLHGIEAELAFRLSDDLPARDKPYSDAEIAERVECMLPLIELVDSRLTEYSTAGDLWKLSDNQINAGLVIGEPIANWEKLDTTKQRVIQSFDGEVVVDNTGWNFPGTPIGLLRRVADTCRHCGGLKAGQIATMGSMTGILFVERGTKVTAEFEGLQTLSVTV